jgi:signal transduction histidine kinase
MRLLRSDPGTVQRVVTLVSRMSAACQSAVTLRTLADAAARALTELFPGSSVVVFERDAHRDVVRAVAGARIPAVWQMRAVLLQDIPLVAEALRAPERIIRSSARHRPVADPTDPSDPLAPGRLQALCAAVPDVSEPLYALMFLAPPATGAEAEAREAAIETARQLLAATTAVGGAGHSRTLAAIHRAKREWEQTADALPDVVGLIDSRRRVVRISRALERWSLGDVRGAIGRDLHAVFHPKCTDGCCALDAALHAALAALATKPLVTFELADPGLERDLVVILNAATEIDGETPSAPWRRIAFVVLNVTSLRRVERELTALTRTLEERVEERTAALSRANDAMRAEVNRRRAAENSLRASQRELEAMSEQLINAQEGERKRIAQDLHDSVGQGLSAMKYSLERAQVLVRRHEPRAAAEVVEAVVERAQRLIDEVRSISMNLRPAMLDDLGAASAVRSFCREWHSVYSDIAIETDISISDAEIPRLLVTNVYRAVQESLNNVARHAGAQHVRVAMRIDDGTLKVTIEDDGTGFAISGDVRRLVDRPELRGLRGLRDRAARTGGHCHVVSAPGRGTTVHLEWPIAVGLAAREASARLN